MSKGTVHEIAAGGFGTGTNDLVSLALEGSPPCAALELVY